MLDNYDGKIFLDGEVVRKLPAKTTYHVKEFLKRVQLSEVQKYAMSLLDAHHPLTEGVRVPSLLPIATGT